MLYNYKSDECIQDVILECLCPLIEDLEDEYDSLRRNQALYVYAPSYIAREIVARVLEDFCDDSIRIDEECNVELLQKKCEDILITIVNDGVIYIEESRCIDGKFKDSNNTSALNYVYDCYKKQEIDDLAEREDSILIFGYENEDICVEMDNDESKCDSKPESTTNIHNNCYEVTVKYNLDTEDTLKVIEDMEKHMGYISDIFHKMFDF